MTDDTPLQKKIRAALDPNIDISLDLPDPIPAGTRRPTKTYRTVTDADNIVASVSAALEGYVHEDLEVLEAHQPVIDKALAAVHSQEPGRTYTVAEVKDILYPLVTALRACTSEPRVFPKVIDLDTDECIGHADTMSGGWSYASGYLKGQGSEVGDGRRMLLLTRTGQWATISAGAMIGHGNDWDQHLLEQNVMEAEAALDKARMALTVYECGKPVSGTEEEAS